MSWLHLLLTYLLVDGLGCLWVHDHSNQISPPYPVGCHPRPNQHYFPTYDLVEIHRSLSSPFTDSYSRLYCTAFYNGHPKKKVQVCFRDFMFLISEVKINSNPSLLTLESSQSFFFFLVPLKISIEEDQCTNVWILEAFPLLKWKR